MVLQNVKSSINAESKDFSRNAIKIPANPDWICWNFKDSVY